MNGHFARLEALVTVALIAAHGAAALAAQQAPAGFADGIAAFNPWISWAGYELDRRVVAASLEADRRTLEASLAAKPPSVPVLVARLDLALRAGHREAARDLLAELSRRHEFSGPLCPYVASFLEQREEWDLARQLAFAFPRRVVSRAVVEHIAMTEGEEAADRFLEHQTLLGGANWAGEWVTFWAARGDVEPVFKRLEAAVRAEPASFDRAESYQAAVSAAGNRATGTAGKSRDVNWMGQVCRPASPSECYRLGTSLLWMKAPRAAITLLKRSLGVKIAPKDTDWVYDARPMQTPENRELALRRWTHKALAEAYKAAGEPRPARLHAETGRRMEEAVPPQRREKPKPDYSPLGRARYYAAHKQDKQARRAFEKALAQAPMPPKEQANPLRADVLWAYAEYLRAHDGRAAAVELYRQELRKAPVGSATRDQALWTIIGLGSERKPAVHWDDPVLWGFLASSPRWDSTEEECLSWMLERAKPAERPQVIARAEALCKNADPSRARVLGGLCLRRGANEPAARLFKDAVARLPEGKQRGSAAFALFRAYLNLGQAAEAEGQLPAAMRYWLSALSPGAQWERVPEWIAQAALLAAKAGDTVRAMRLWRRVADVDGAALSGLLPLAEAGLRDDLRRFYLDWQQADPASWVPAEALKQLAQAQ